MQGVVPFAHMGSWPHALLLLLVLSTVAVSLGVLRLVWRRTGRARTAGVCLLLTASAWLTVGLWVARAEHRRALATLSAATPPSAGPASDAARWLAEARGVATLALGLALVPCLAACAVWALSRRRPSSVQGEPAATEDSPSHRPLALRASGVVASVVLASALAAANAAELRALLSPGYVLPGEQPRGALRAAETARDLRQEAACRELRGGLEAESGDTLRVFVPDAEDVLHHCTGARIDEALIRPPAERGAALRAVVQDEPMDEVNRARVEAALRSIAPGPSPAAAEPELQQKTAGPEADGLGVDVSSIELQGELTRDEIVEALRVQGARLRSCLDRARRRAPDLRVDVDLRFTVDNEGKVKLADARPRQVMKGKRPWRLDSTARPCWVHALQGTAFPRPRGGEVRVRLPLHLD